MESHSGDISSSPDPLDVISNASDESGSEPETIQEGHEVPSSPGSSDTDSGTPTARTTEDRRRQLDNELERLETSRRGSASVCHSNTASSPPHNLRQDIDEKDEEEEEEEDDWAIFKDGPKKRVKHKRNSLDTPITAAPLFSAYSPHRPTHPFRISPTRRTSNPDMYSPTVSGADKEIDISAAQALPNDMFDSQHRSLEVAGGVVDSSLVPQDAEESGAGEIKLETETNDVEAMRLALVSEPDMAEQDSNTDSRTAADDQESLMNTGTEKAHTPLEVLPPAEETVTAALDSYEREQTTNDHPATIKESRLTIIDDGVAVLASDEMTGATKGDTGIATGGDNGDRDDTPGSNESDKAERDGQGAILIAVNDKNAVTESVAPPVLPEQEDTVRAETVGIKASVETSGNPSSELSSDIMDVDQPISTPAAEIPAPTSPRVVEEGEEELGDDDRQPQSDGIVEEENDVDVDMEDASASASAAVATPSDSGTPSVKGKPGPKKKPTAKPKAKQQSTKGATKKDKDPKPTKAKTKVDDLKAPAAKKSKLSRDTPVSSPESRIPPCGEAS